MDKPSQTRSRIMSSVRQKNTTPELIVRRILHAAGFRFRLHDRRLPGTPDLVLKKYKVTIFVHGCFWHFHQNCRYSKIPASNSAFWLDKLEKNVARDYRKTSQLLENHWRVIVVWECATRTNPDILLRDLTSLIAGVNINIDKSEIQEYKLN